MTRLEHVLALRAEGKTLREIGEGLGLTRERIRQILADDPPNVRHCRCGCGTVMGYLQRYAGGHRAEGNLRACKCGCGAPAPRYQQYAPGHRPHELLRLCRCGCGGAVTRYQRYIRGHRPGEPPA